MCKKQKESAKGGVARGIMQVAAAGDGVVASWGNVRCDKAKAATAR